MLEKHHGWLGLFVMMVCMASAGVSEAATLRISAHILPGTCDIRLENPWPDGVMRWQREIFRTTNAAQEQPGRDVRVSFAGCSRRSVMTQAVQLQVVNAGVQDAQLSRRQLWGTRYESGLGMEMYVGPVHGRQYRIAPGISRVSVTDFQPRSLLSGEHSEPSPTLGVTVFPRHYSGTPVGEVKTIFFLSAVYG